ncbi:hypothetical protein QFC19_000652 [Naganishia cerealis]|uniref:Uncharacterized protein n=1 Tax=Naganishia cerealis TaxID=610337 RepID=A0ACC2WNJ8_9TREE|nr:hypothetical protein QFC19_000652 [Naganishia cerealis]
MPPRRKGAGKMNAAASKRAGKQQAASSPRERSTTTVVFKPEDGTVDTKSKPALLQVPPSTTLAADPSPVKEKISMPNKEETYSLTDETAAGASMDINKAISPAKEFEVAPGAQRPDSDIGQTDEVQNHSQTAIKQATTVTYPDSETEDVSDREHEETTRIGQIEQPLEEVEMDIADDEENESDTLDIPFSTEKIRHTSPISARVLQNVRALKEEILNGGGNMSGIGRVASFNLGRIDNSPDDGMQEANGDVVLTGAPRKVSALSHSPRQSTGDIQGGGQRSVDSVETTTRLAEIGSSSPPAWGRGALKREPLQEEKFPGYAPEDSRAFKRPRKDSFHSASLQSGESNRWRSGQVGDDRSREQERDNVRDNERYIERSQRMDEDYQGMRTDRREGFSTQSQQSNQNISGRNLEEARTRVGLENQVDSRLRDHDSGKVQREEQRDTARDNFKPFDTERRPSGAFPIPPRPPSLAPPALQHVRENQGPPPFPPPFPPPAHYSARAPPVPPAMLASAQSLRPSPTWPPATKRQHETDSLAETGPRSSPYPSRSNAGFGRPTDAGTAPLRDEQQPPNCLPHNAPGPTERKGFQDRKTPLTAEPMNRARENWNLPTSSSLPVNPSALPSLTAANLGANARHDDFPPRSTGRPASRVSDDGRSNVSEARR